MPNNAIPESTQFPPKDQYTVGVSPDFRFVTFNIPASRPGDEVQNPAFTLILTPTQADALVELLKRGSNFCRKRVEGMKN